MPLNIHLIPGRCPPGVLALACWAFALGSGPPAAAQEVSVMARTRGDRFEVRERGAWRPFYVRGVNLGVALPGRFPAEFPADSATYARWLRAIAGMGGNSVRVYTILPPAFYRALRGWNLVHPAEPLRLVHGVWTELPPRHDFDDPAWKAEFTAEARRVVDLVHGRAEIPRRPGHATGHYDADVSRWTLAYLIGREWEPYAVQGYLERHPGPRDYSGRLLQAVAVPAMDAWMAAQCDAMLAYELDRYRALRPIAYTNWPTLDPLHHPTESTAEEERRWRGDSAGGPPGATESHEEDAVALDAMLVRPTAANPAGWYASYHVYPYYPDFLDNDPGYAQARSSEGQSSYFGYLRELKRHHAGIPLLIAEYGVPSSRGVAHFQPQGWDHGGHDEAAMAAIDARLTREIRESGAAGGIVFAWLDEWFKRSWIVANFEIPAEHTPRWHNVMDPEQSYGILGLYPNPPRDDCATAALPCLSADASYLHLTIPLPAVARGHFPWDSLSVQLFLDTYAPDRGQRVVADGWVRSEVGFEFLTEFRSPADAEIRITPDYNPYSPASGIVRGDDFGRFYRHPAASVAREDGRFDSLFVITNRARFARDGTCFPAQGYNRGRLRYGRPGDSTLADWYLDTRGRLRVRLAWGLLNVTDPSSHRVLDQRDGAPLSTTETEGIRVGVVLRRKTDGAIVAALPSLVGDTLWRAAALTPWRWRGWTEPRWHARLKPVYDSLKAAWR